MSDRIFLIWKADSHRGENIPIACLSETGDGGYRFAYLKGFSRARGLGLDPLPEFPDEHRVYKTSSLPSLFANRLMSPRRPDFQEFIRSLGLEERESGLASLDILNRSRGRKTTDRFRMFLAPRRKEGRFNLQFFSAGLSRETFQPNHARLESLNPGDALQLLPDPQNSHDRNAILLVNDADLKAGFVPAYYASELTKLLKRGAKLDARVLHINRPLERWAPDAILVEVSGEWPEWWSPFQSGDYAWLAEAAAIAP